LIILIILGEEYKVWKTSMQFPPASRHFISLRSKCSPQHPVLRHPTLMSETKFYTHTKPQERW
jgi:hypothetical protein